ncbi:MAG TPA: hypothetical protein VGM54_01205 [Chthoniobacter sp.]
MHPQKITHAPRPGCWKLPLESDSGTPFGVHPLCRCRLRGCYPRLQSVSPSGWAVTYFLDALLGIVTISQDASHRSESVGDTRRLNLEKSEHSLVCEFTVEKADLANADASFIFTMFDRHGMPAVDFVFFRLLKFAAAKSE